jgi:alpha-glucosidase
MTLKNNLLYLIIAVLALGTSCSGKLQLSSPDGDNRISIELNDRGELYYTLTTQHSELVAPSRLGFSTMDSLWNFTDNLIFTGAEETAIDEIYSLPTGKCSQYINKANEKRFTFRNRSGREFQLVCRAYDDGMAFRYELPGLPEICVTHEHTRIVFPGHEMTWMMNYVPSYETNYPERLLDTVGMQPLSYPALVRTSDGKWVLLTEASVYDQPGTHLRKTGNGNELQIVCPQEYFTVYDKWESPWRTFIIGDELADIVESVLVENLNPPSVLSNTDWIDPGVVVFPWWGNYLANSYIDTLKKYVDLASAMNWNWIEFDVSLIGSPFTRTSQWEQTPWITDFMTYAASKGVNVYGWDEMSIIDTREDRDYLFGRYRDLGIKGIKIDFLNSDQAYAMRFRNDAMSDAIQYGLMVSFHGETVPRGQRRRYPNNMTNEAVLGAEYYTFKGSEFPDPAHNCTLPFTRNVVGPMDYTPVTFTIRPENPRKTSYAHELALGIIFESGWMVVADRPEAYLESPAKPLLQKLQASWNETQFIDGYPGKYVCMARRKGEDWYLAAINAGPERTLDVPLNFLEQARYSAVLYSDKIGEEQTNIDVADKEIEPGSMLQIQLAANGGFAAFITKIIE